MHLLACSSCSVKICFSNILRTIIAFYWVLCRVGLTPSGWLWGSGVTTPLWPLMKSVQRFFSGNQHLCVPSYTVFPALSLTTVLHFLTDPQCVCQMSIWLHCDSNYYFFLTQLIVLAAFSPSLLCKMSLRWCLTRTHIKRNKLFLGSAVYLFFYFLLC